MPPNPRCLIHQPIHPLLRPPLLLPLPITILINNVGGGTAGIMRNSDFAPFASHTPREISAVIAVNASFPTHLTASLLPTLIRNSPSLIGSASAIGIPYVSVYSATKSFNMAPSVALTRELSAEHPGIEVLGIVVGAAQTARTRSAGMQKALAVPSQEGMARAALGRAGCERAVVEGYGGMRCRWRFCGGRRSGW
jgi:17beta-estradiol 17-dehydrogenase / very-long-chain 3-oxoacyl-CoA reductase